MKQNRQRWHFYICLVVAVVFTINLIRSYIDTGDVPIASLIFPIVVYIATILSTYTLISNDCLKKEYTFQTFLITTHIMLRNLLYFC